jgi:PhzF family phenazine biosynthesis protein
MRQAIVQVDAFTAEPFTGNPAAVCLLREPRPEAWLQAVAREMNLSETAFLLRQGDGFRLRWFTPSVEVDLCGHATLASAHVLWEENVLAGREPARFHTRSGLLTADRAGDWIELDFPATPAAEAPTPAGLLEALGGGRGGASAIAARFVGRTRFDYLIELDSEDVIRGLRPDWGALRALPVRGVMVTAPATTSGFDFVSRFFAPGSGIDEDPVTGSSHCALGPFWGDRLGKRELLARQVSARGGIVRVRLAGERVRLGGQAVTVLRGELI